MSHTPMPPAVKPPRTRARYITAVSIDWDAFGTPGTPDTPNDTDSPGASDTQGTPGAQIFSFDDGRIHEVAYEETESYQVTELFINNREGLLRQLP